MNKFISLFFFLNFFRKYILFFSPIKWKIFIFALGREFFFTLLIKKFSFKKISSFQKKNQYPFQKENKEKKIFGLTFRHSLGNAAGFDKNGDLLAFHYQIGAGFAIVGTVLNQPHKGNLFSFLGKKVNVWLPLDHSKSAINSLGLPSLGIDKVIVKIQSFRKNFITEKNPYGKIENFPIAISLMGHPLEEGQKQLDGILDCMEKSSSWVEIMEINESCPNIRKTVKKSNAEQQFINRVEKIAKKRKEIFEKTGKKIILWFKFSTLNNIPFLIDLLDSHEIESITLSNTLKNYSSLSPKIKNKEQRQFEYYTQNYGGGVSGKAIWQQVEENKKELQKIIKEKNSPLKIIHCGGIFEPTDLKIAQKNTVLQQWYTGFIHQYLKNSNVYDKF